jgi:hypothetical protein
MEAQVNERRVHFRENAGLAICNVIISPRAVFARREPARDELFPEQAARGVLIVRLAQQAKILDGSLAAQRERMAVFERQEPPLRAAATSGVDKGTLPAVALPDLPRDGERNMPRIRPRLQDSTRLTGTESPLLLALDERVEGPFEEPGQVTIGQSMARELLRQLDLRAKRGARSEFDAIALCGKGLDSRSSVTRRLTLASAWPRTGKLSARAGRRRVIRTHRTRSRAAARFGVEREGHCPERLDACANVRTRKLDREQSPRRDASEPEWAGSSLQRPFYLDRRSPRRVRRRSHQRKSAASRTFRENHFTILPISI